MKESKKAIMQIYPNMSLWVEETAAFIYRHAQLNVFEKDQFVLCLAGGSTPRRVYERLARGPYDQAFPWSKTLLFWGDERAVPREHEDSNFRMVKEALLDHVDIPSEHIFDIKGAETPKVAADRYHLLLKDYDFDLTLLGLGEDGHTASLFPDTTILTSEKRAAVVFVPKFQAHRISVTRKKINASKKVAFLVVGDNKASILKEVYNSDQTDLSYPAQMIKPSHGDLYWLVDDAAWHLMK